MGILWQNLIDSIDNMGLQEMFKKYGTIVPRKVATSEDGKSKGRGFVQFGTPESANAAIGNLNGSAVGDNKL